MGNMLGRVHVLDHLATSYSSLDNISSTPLLSPLRKISPISKRKGAMANATVTLKGHDGFEFKRKCHIKMSTIQVP